MPEPPPTTSTEWQRLASRRAFQKDLPGAIDAMRQAVALDPNSFHHWMWLGNLYRQQGDAEGARQSAREGLRCLYDAPDPSISPEERARLIVRASLHAGDLDHAAAAVVRLESLRQPELEACLEASTFEDWYEADRFAAPIFETLLELRLILGDPEKTAAAAQRYVDSLDRGLRLGAEADASADDLEILRQRRANIE